MFAGRPIIGIAGGIGSGKTFVANLFGELGCYVLRADDHVHAAYSRDDVKSRLREWWGGRAFDAAGGVDRRAVAGIVFADAGERARLEALIHPIVNAERWAEMERHAADPGIVAWVWDVPLLYEAGLHRSCDRVVFVDASDATRLRRVQGRGWNEADWQAREKSQFPLDKKRSISDDYISNDDGIDVVREQVRDVLSRILAGRSSGASLEER